VPPYGQSTKVLTVLCIRATNYCRNVTQKHECSRVGGIANIYTSFITVTYTIRWQKYDSNDLGRNKMCTSSQICMNQKTTYIDNMSYLRNLSLLNTEQRLHWKSGHYITWRTWKWTRHTLYYVEYLKVDKIPFIHLLGLTLFSCHIIPSCFSKMQITKNSVFLHKYIENECKGAVSSSWIISITVLTREGTHLNFTS
jgi:hypothetical protein